MVNYLLGTETGHPLLKISGGPNSRNVTNQTIMAHAVLQSPSACDTISDLLHSEQLIEYARLYPGLASEMIGERHACSVTFPIIHGIHYTNTTYIPPLL